MKLAKCDNCKRMEDSSIEKQDVTDSAIAILQAVRRLSNSRQFKQRNFTLNHMVDIWRGKCYVVSSFYSSSYVLYLLFLPTGSKCQKVVQCQWDSDPLYGKATHLTALEANRIIKKLILEGFLWEELVVNKDCGASAYLKLGPKSTKLLSGEAGRIFHQVQVKKSSQERSEVWLVLYENQLFVFSSGPTGGG